MHQLPVLDATLPRAESSAPPCVALIGNPNAGKTTLFNVLTGLRAKTANYPGVTVDVRKGKTNLHEQSVDLVDLPGLYSLDAMSPEEQMARAFLHGELEGATAPDAVVLVLDATNLQRNLFLAGEVLELGLPTVIALNLFDAARAQQIDIDVEQLSATLGCPVVAVSSRKRHGIDELRQALEQALELTNRTADAATCAAGCDGCLYSARHAWADELIRRTVVSSKSTQRRLSKGDRLLTNPWIGVAAFLGIMLFVFYLIFSLADLPMTLIEDGFSRMASLVDQFLPETKSNALLWHAGVIGSAQAVFAVGYRLAKKTWNRKTTAIAIAVSVLVSCIPVEDFKSLIIDGVIGGVGGVVVFLPQICILFFFIAILEDSGYMARAAFVMERLMRKVGLPGKAFVPMLSAHACAIPGIMSARVIENWRDRLVTILVLPLLTCSARLPVYAMIAALLFGDSPGRAALVFVGAYALGVVAAFGTAALLKRTILPGESAPLILELPDYRLPSLKTALLCVVDRANVFLRKAGTAILAIAIVLWFLATYPKLPQESPPTSAQLTLTSVDDSGASSSGSPQEKEAVREEKLAQQQLAYSFAGRLGKAVEPIFRPLGFDWQINVGVISSFAAREVLISTLAIVYGKGEDVAEDQPALVETLRGQRRADGSPVFTLATSLSLLVFYVLAMQCLPTQAVTKRETGSWKWAGFQLVYMTLLAYGAALVVYQSLSYLQIT